VRFLSSLKDDPSRAAAALLALFAVSSAWAIWVQQHFSIDGCHFFVELLRKKAFIYGADFPRHHAHYVTQALAVALMKAGVRRPELLSLAFGFGLYFPLFAGTAICAVVARRADPRLVLFPLLSLFGVSLNHTFMIVHESHVTVALFWPLLFLVLLRERFDKRDALLALALALLFIRTYESVAILGTILVGALALRIREGWRQATPLTRAAWALMLVIFLAGIAIAVHFSLNPRLPGNRADFFASFGRILGHWPALMSLGFIAVIGLLFVVPGLSSSAVAPAATALLAVVAAVVGFSPAVVPDAMRPGLHHATRSHLIIMVPALAVLALAVIRGHLAVSAETWKRVGLLVAFLAVGQTTWQVLACSQWNGFRRIFRQELAAHEGATPFERTALAADRFGMQLARPMTWGWTQPTLSILWAPGRQVRTIILNPAGELGRWQPFDPANARDLPDLEEYGYSTAPYLATLKP
jgi:hypothetical protein